MNFGPHTVTVVQRAWDGTTRDRQNNPVITETGTFDLAGCFVQQLSAEEDLDARESGVSRWLVMAPPPPGGATVGIVDHFRIPADVLHTDPDPGQTYGTLRQVGDPDGLDHIDGTFHHLELILERVQL